MPRKHKIDRPVSRLMYREGLFVDSRSFVSLPDGDDSESHLFLFGKDWERQKERVWERDKGICQLSGQRCGDREADADHILKRSKGGSDDMANLRTVRRAPHDARHPEKQVKWGESRESAKMDFERIYDAPHKEMK